MPTVFFTKGADGVGTGVELWATDGTAVGTHLVDDINPGTGSSDPAALGLLNGKLLFAAADDGGIREVFTTDGVSVTKLAATGLSAPFGLTAIGSLSYFTAVDGQLGREFWSTDGVTLTRVSNAPESTVIGLNFGGRIYYSGNVGGSNSELYSFNPADGSTQLVKDINPGSSSSLPLRLTSLGDKFIFNAISTFGNELWVSDGTAGGTSLLIDLNTNGSGLVSTPSSLAGAYGIAAIAGNKAVFAALVPAGSGQTDKWAIFVTDGTGPGTVRLTPVPDDVNGTRFASSGGKAYFLGPSTTAGTELWVSDGTVGGTHIVKDLNAANAKPAGDEAYGYFSGTDVNGTFFFWGTDGVTGIELYKTDGTDAGTMLVKDINLGSGNARIKTATSMMAVGNELYFNADDGNGSALWRSDGTAGGTVKIVGGPIVSILDFIPGGPTLPAASTIIGTKKADKIDGTHAPAGQPKATNKAESIDGKAGSDTINALGGNDTITGGKGKDVIDGGKGKDAFVFDTKLEASNVDTIKGFKVKDDTIWLDKDVFTKLGEVGDTIGDKAFWKSAVGTAHDKNDRLIYETDTGRLVYDDNGNKAGHAVLIAILDKGLALTQADFLIS